MVAQGIAQRRAQGIALEVVRWIARGEGVARGIALIVFQGLTRRVAKELAFRVKPRNSIPCGSTGDVSLSSLDFFPWVVKSESQG